MEAKLKKTKN